MSLGIDLNRTLSSNPYEEGIAKAADPAKNGTNWAAPFMGLAERTENEDLLTKLIFHMVRNDRRYSKIPSHLVDDKRVDAVVRLGLATAATDGRELYLEPTEKLFSELEKSLRSLGMYGGPEKPANEAVPSGQGAPSVS